METVTIALLIASCIGILIAFVFLFLTFRSLRATGKTLDRIKEIQDNLYGKR